MTSKILHDLAPCLPLYLTLFYFGIPAFSHKLGFIFSVSLCLEHFSSLLCLVNHSLSFSFQFILTSQLKSDPLFHSYLPHITLLTVWNFVFV